MRGNEEVTMAERNERWVINQLIDSCKDGERGFRYAANHVHDAAVKALFTEIASEREQFVVDLLPHAQRLGGANESDGTTAGALHRGWMTIKDALTGHDDAAIIREAERGENAALSVYENALEGLLPPVTRELVERQDAKVRHARERIRMFLIDSTVAPS
jgi:uncharacterized protein (TIGR02284 family)